MKNEKEKGSIAQAEIFCNLEEDGIAELAEMAVKRRLAVGEFAFYDGDTADRLYIIKQGKVKLAKNSSEGNEFIISFMGPGGTFGIVAVLAGKPYPCSARAEMETDAFEIKSKDLLPFLDRHPKMALGIIKVLGERLIDAQNRLQDLAGERVEQRLLNALLRLSLTYGTELPFTRHEIAEMTGTTTETVIRIFGSLKERGIISSKRGKITIVDDARLRQLC